MLKKISKSKFPFFKKKDFILKSFYRSTNELDDVRKTLDTAQSFRLPQK